MTAHLATGHRTPPFRPHPPDATFYLRPPAPSSSSSSSAAWIPNLSAECHFTLPLFLSTLKSLTVHPERNSSLILRADVLPPKPSSPTHPPDGGEDGYQLVEEIRVRLMPKQPKRDGKMDQTCVFYRTPSGGGWVVMRAEVNSVEEVPFYHPPVKAVGFYYQPLDKDQHDLELGEEGCCACDDGAEDEPPVRGVISIAYLPFDDIRSSIPPATHDTSMAQNPFLPVQRKPPRKRSPLVPTLPDETLLPLTNGQAPTQGDSLLSDDSAVQTRLSRTLLALLERVYHHAFGLSVGYTKRMQHDVVVARDSFQDLYLVLKERHRHLDSRASKPGSNKLEDVKRHVWKDVAVAAFLMLLWRDMYPPWALHGLTENEWDGWGRPDGGFVDLGCGYEGIGLELRARRTWPLYPAATQAALIETPITPPEWFPQTMAEWRAGSWPSKPAIIKDHSFLIGNHADELTASLLMIVLLVLTHQPWIPLISLTPATPVPYLSVPCCTWDLDRPFTLLHFTATHRHAPAEGLQLGPTEHGGKYGAYLAWLAQVGLECGWEWEKEGLRVPSTRGWGIVARKRWTREKGEVDACRVWALQQVEGVRARGVFKVREKEGKDH